MRVANFQPPVENRASETVLRDAKQVLAALFDLDPNSINPDEDVKLLTSDGREWKPSEEALNKIDDFYITSFGIDPKLRDMKTIKAYGDAQQWWYRPVSSSKSEGVPSQFRDKFDELQTMGISPLHLDLYYGFIDQVARIFLGGYKWRKEQGGFIVSGSLQACDSVYQGLKTNVKRLHSPAML